MAISVLSLAGSISKDVSSSRACVLVIKTNTTTYKRKKAEKTGVFIEKKMA